MGCPAEVQIDDNLVFSITTHDPDTGVLTDADAVPTWRLYEDETGAAILNGDMAKLDDGNTTGFYTELVACSVGNGFEDGKSYTIYIEATVDSDKGGISFGFKAVTRKAREGADSDTLETLSDQIDAIPTTMVGTDNAALASVVGALADGAADGDPTTGDTVMQYIKQLINVLMGSDGIVAFPAAAAPGNGVSLAESIRAIYDDTNSLDGTKIPDTISLDAIADATWDEILTGATHNIATSAGRRLRGIQEFQGYENGSIWIDTVNGSAGTTDFENGTVENPVNSIADANTLAASLGMSQFTVISGSSITFAASQTAQVFMGSNWTLDLGGEDVAGTEIIGASVSGVMGGTGTMQIFKDCVLGAISLIKNTHILSCSIEGTLTLVEAGDIFLDSSHSGVAGTATPAFDFGGSIGTSNINFRHYSGGIEIQNMGGAGTDTMSLEGNGQLIINANCSAGTVAIRGNFTVTDNASAAVTLSDDARYDITQVADAAWDEVLSAATHNIANSAGRRIRDLASVVIITGTSPGTGNTSTRIKLDGDASSTDGAYDPAVITITGGTGMGQSRQIFEYDGANKFAYVNRDWKVTPNATSEYTISANSGDSHVNEGVATGGSATTITLNALASAVNDFYVGQVIFLVAGMGADQARRVLAYNGGTQVATVETWDTNPDTTTVYSMLPQVAKDLSAAQVNAEVDTALSDYDGPTKAEMDTGHGLLATESKQDIIDTNVDDIETAVITNAAGTDVAADIIALKAVADAIQAKTDNQPAGIPKNVALSNFMFLMMDSADHITPKTGLTVTAEISKDGAAFGPSSNSASEVSDGMYKIDWIQAEMNADVITFKFTAAGADDRFITITTSA